MLPLRLIQAYESIMHEGFARFFRDLAFFNRKAIVFRKDLREAVDPAGLFEKSSVSFVDIDEGLLSDPSRRFLLKNRLLKAKRYLAGGCGGHALVHGNDIIGDIWYYPLKPWTDRPAYKDLHWLGVSARPDEVYMFDLHLVNDSRGKNLSAALQSASMHALREKGFSNAYGYCWADNLPAVWTTRVNRWKEIKSLRVHSFMLVRIPAGGSDE